MVFNSLIIASVAHTSADLWQEIARIQVQDRISSHQLLDLICCFPLQQLGSFALWLWTFLCLPPPDSFYPYTYYSSTTTTSSSDYGLDHDQNLDYDEDDVPDHPPPHLRYALGSFSSSSSSSSSSSVDLHHYYHHSHSD
ncbi:conserved hypothetical protein [Ricinus communis]|uniref:Uncharacterized protein n=1 Tax=Ricinus communis TaxID=3988 RepID=B9SBP8_RICCO|nr:conserved hypothetical protein [Ricinus communis]|eukprot:XP_002523417.1 uncharacterized protein LOC8282175 [Ricinus communis]